LRQWWKARPTTYDDGGVAPEQSWLFPGRSKHRPLTTRQFGRLFKEAAKAAGLRKTLSLHALRHNAESRIMPSNLSVVLVQRTVVEGHSA
jgi:integrase/recombinase XerD